MLRHDQQWLLAIRSRRSRCTWRPPWWSPTHRWHRTGWHWWQRSWTEPRRGRGSQAPLRRHRRSPKRWRATERWWATSPGRWWWQAPWRGTEESPWRWRWACWRPGTPESSYRYFFHAGAATTSSIAVGSGQHGGHLAQNSIIRPSSGQGISVWLDGSGGWQWWSSTGSGRSRRWRQH